MSDIEDLIEASSLGTPEARAARKAGRESMQGPLFEEALEVVAREVIARLCEGFEGSAWEDYPDLSERDFADLAALVRRLGQDQGPEAGRFEAAYGLLASRAES